MTNCTNDKKPRLTDAWDKLKEALSYEKTKLIKEFSSLLDDCESSDNKCIGTYDELEGKFFIGCNPETKRSSGSGKGRFKHHHWITIIFEHKKNNYVERYSYCLNLCQEHMDLKTGNVHQDFTKLQLNRNLYRGSQVGGQFSPRPGIRYIYDSQINECLECTELLIPNQYIYPECTKTQKNLPWAKNYIERHASVQIPSFDMKDKNYDAEKVAKFVLDLVKDDIENSSPNERFKESK
ncbi:MAG: hypothetical protein MJ189_02575 [Coriobacteriales bacterium]|nr:hypothetical protein [Coriobacteriales bacterium]